MTTATINHVPVKALPDFYAIPALILTALILAYSTKVGFVAILVLYALWLPQLLLRPSQIIRPFGSTLFLLLLPFLCTYSFFWSNVPERSIYFGFQFFTMVICTIIVARTVTIETLIKGLALGCTFVLLISLASGNYQRDYFSNEYSLIGYFGSKNQVGLFADVGIITSLILLFSAHERRTTKLGIAVPSLIIGIICLFLSKSAASLICLIATVGVLIFAWFITRFNPRLRIIILILGGLFVLTAFVSFEAIGLNLQTATLQSVGKDSTLTGRTYLWSEGIKAGLQRPWLGWGYSGFWAPGQPLAERYWDEFGITAKTGFHFHNTFIQTYVDIGILGLLGAIGVVLLILWRSGKRILQEDLSLTSSFAFAFAVMFSIRAMVEVEFLGQFSLGTLLVFIIIPLLNRQPLK